MLDGLSRLEDILNKAKQKVQTNARAVVAQVNPNDNGATYNTVKYQQHQKQNPAAFPATYAKPAGQLKPYEDDGLVYTNKGVTMPLRSVGNDTQGKPVQWQDPSTGNSPTGFVSPTYRASADAWAKRGKWGGLGNLF